MNRLEITRGIAFADELRAIVLRLGPEELSPPEREALADHLSDCAIQWVVHRSRINRAAAQ